ncbi:MAG: hypothetical protein KAQ99_02170 [Candidatus Aureabacteria bacterium]|nr:hypothetical protein [Candidatus Auribacterota bacterium]
MEILNGILKEELNRLKNLKKIYERKLNKLPKGCLVRKKIKGHIYYYLNYRDGSKGIFKYLGRLDNGALSEINNNINERRKLRKLYIQLKKDIVKLGKISHGKKK